jgi:hypothetical protein
LIESWLLINAFLCALDPFKLLTKGHFSRCEWRRVQDALALLRGLKFRSHVSFAHSGGTARVDRTSCLAGINQIDAFVEMVIRSLGFSRLSQEGCSQRVKGLLQVCIGQIVLSKFVLSGVYGEVGKLLDIAR